MSDPTHPGAIARKLYEDRGWREHKAVRMIGLGRTKVRYFLNGTGRCTPEIAVALCNLFGGKPLDWLLMQATYDLAQFLNSSSLAPA